MICPLASRFAHLRLEAGLGQRAVPISNQAEKTPRYDRVGVSTVIAPTEQTSRLRSRSAAGRPSTYGETVSVCCELQKARTGTMRRSAVSWKPWYIVSCRAQAYPWQDVPHICFDSECPRRGAVLTSSAVPGVPSRIARCIQDRIRANKRVKAATRWKTLFPHSITNIVV